MIDEIRKNFSITEKILELTNEDEDCLLFSEWTKKKANLRYNCTIPKFPIIDNFIYWADLGINIGSEQNKYRPVLVFNTSKKSKICTIIPLTTKHLSDEYWYHIDLNKINSTAMVEQMKVISKLRIDKPFRLNGQMVAIDTEDWNKINQQLSRMYRLKPLKCKKILTIQ